jgi:phosphohistidine phosphatase SixA
MEKTNYLDFGFGRHKSGFTRKYGIKKKICLGCRAYENDECLLGKKIEKIDDKNLLVVRHKPIDKYCNKPKTWKEFKKEEKRMR